MNTEIDQKISQFLDGEMDHADLDHFLFKMKQDPDLKKKMTRYQLTGHVLRSDDVPLLKDDFLQKVNQELENDPIHFLPDREAKKRQSTLWYKTSAAIAASLALMAVVLNQQALDNSIPTTQNLVQTETISLAQTVTPVRQIAPVHKKVVEQPSQHERLKAYLQAHSDDIYTHGSVNYHPHARVASFGRD